MNFVDVDGLRVVVDDIAFCHAIGFGMGLHKDKIQKNIVDELTKNLDAEGLSKVCKSAFLDACKKGEFSNTAYNSIMDMCIILLNPTRFPKSSK